MIAVIYIFSHGAQIRLGWAYRHFFCLISGRTVVRAKVYVKKGPITCLSNSSLGVFSIHFVKEARAFTLLDGLATAGDVRVLDRKPQWASPAARDVERGGSSVPQDCFRVVTLLLRHEDEVKPHTREV